jgi:hypothetical protein
MAAVSSHAACGKSGPCPTLRRNSPPTTRSPLPSSAKLPGSGVPTVLRLVPCECQIPRNLRPSSEVIRPSHTVTPRSGSPSPSRQGKICRLSSAIGSREGAYPPSGWLPHDGCTGVAVFTLANLLNLHVFSIWFLSAMCRLVHSNGLLFPLVK